MTVPEPMPLPWKRVGVMGLGVTGVATAGFLSRRGVAVVAADARERSDLSEDVDRLVSGGVELHLSGNSEARDLFRSCDLIITSPGVPPTSLPLAGARESGIPVRAEVELAASYVRGPIVGITGSNGKSTVTALVGEILREAGLVTRTCGNIGTPLIEVAESDLALSDEEARRVHYVVELSSFQLEGIDRFRAKVAVLLNLSPDHLDRYETPEDYFSAKARIFTNQTGDDIAILNWDDQNSIRYAERLSGRLFAFSVTQDLEEGAVVNRGQITLRRGSGDEEVMSLSRIPLIGSHNVENVLAACAAAAHCGVDAKTMARAIAGFRGLAHRLELVCRVGGVSWYDDSKATNVGAARRALQSFDTPVILLMGGRDKQGDFESLREDLEFSDKVRGLVTFGEAGNHIGRRLEKFVPRAVVTATLEEAVEEAARMAQPGDTVLLAPGCSSFDAYTGFAARGDAFRTAVATLAGMEGTG